MRRLLCLLIRIYPRQWRARYQDEITALIQESSPRWTDLLDLFYGAILMQTRTRTLVKTFTASVIGCLALSLAIAVSTPEQYVSIALLEPPGNSPDEVFATFRKALPGDLQRLKKDIRVVRRNTKEFEVSFRASDPARAHAANASLVQKLIHNGRFVMLEPPTQPQHPVAPKYSSFAGGGIAAGLVLGAGAAFWLRLRARLAA
jgi:hypothetical protein